MSYTFGDGQIQCPYNPSHVVSRLRAIPHLAKCRQQHPHLRDEIAICPYNQGHHVPIHHLPTHLQSCAEFCATKSVAASHPSRPSALPSGHTPAAGQLTSTNAATTATNEDELSEWM